MLLQGEELVPDNDDPAIASASAVIRQSPIMVVILGLDPRIHSKTVKRSRGDGWADS